MSQDDIIQLNVGGESYTTTRSTLCRYPDSMLGAMFSGHHDCKVDDRGCVFIDRDGLMFKYILNFLRSGKLSLPNGFKDFNLLTDEADFYQIQPLVRELRDTTEGDINNVQVIEIVEYRQLIQGGEDHQLIIFGKKHILQNFITLTDYNCFDEADGYAHVYDFENSLHRFSLRQALRNDGWVLKRTSTTSAKYKNSGLALSYTIREEFEKVDTA